MSLYRNGIKVDARGVRRFDKQFRVSVLDLLDKGETEDAACLKFHITKRELKKITCWRKRLNQVPAHKELALKERTLRERLYDRAVSAVEESLDPLELVVEKSPILKAKGGMEHLPTAIGHLRNRGQNAIKTLEGLGDFRRGGDEIPHEAPRQPLFSLPPGSHVAVRLDITTSQEEPHALTIESSGGPSKNAQGTTSVGSKI